MDNVYRRMRPLLGTYVEIGTADESTDNVQAITEAFHAIESIQKLLSFHDSKSDLSRINTSQGEWVSVDPLSLQVLKYAQEITFESHGLFNCTVGGILQKIGVLPEYGSEYLDSGEATDFEINRDKVRLLRPVRITLDGIAKGFAVDRAISSLKRNELKTGWVNAGGDLRVYGDLCLPIRRRELDGELPTLGSLKNQALATSAVRRKPDSRFGGLIVTANHKRLEEGVWSVVADTAWRADALTKVAGLAPAHQAQAIVRRLGGEIIEPASERAS
jgi:FAD:protein FMN transferase